MTDRIPASWDMNENKNNVTTAFAGYICSCGFLDLLIQHPTGHGCISGVAVLSVQFKGTPGGFFGTSGKIFLSRKSTDLAEVPSSP